MHHLWQGTLEQLALDGSPIREFTDLPLFGRSVDRERDARKHADWIRPFVKLAEAKFKATPGIRRRRGCPVGSKRRSVGSGVVHGLIVVNGANGCDDDLGVALIVWLYPGDHPGRSLAAPKSCLRGEHAADTFPVGEVVVTHEPR